jgi:(p)ppGpp synthase/HD superfamily hydrolase
MPEMRSHVVTRALSSAFSEALQYATQLHAGQLRKGTTIPYISHLLGVCDIVLSAGGDEIEAIAALLHDGPEDCGGQPILDEIAAKFCADVASVVEGCSDSLVDTAIEEKPPWRDRKEAYIKRLLEEPTSMLLVSAADKLHNARAIERDVIELLGR